MLISFVHADNAMCSGATSGRHRFTSLIVIKNIIVPDHNYSIHQQSQ